MVPARGLDPGPRTATADGTYETEHDLVGSLDDRSRTRRHMWRGRSLARYGLMLWFQSIWTIAAINLAVRSSSAC